jgi:glycosyltransferase involved in cell wall biosynthesis
VLRGLVAELRRSPGLVHAHDAHAVTLGGLGAALTGRPLLATRRVDFPLRRRGFWGRAACIVAISRAVADVLVADGIPRERITVVHSGIDLAEVRRTARLGIRGRLGLPAEAVVAVNVAALVPHKDHATLLRAAAALADRLPGLHWVVAGEGTERAALERLRAELGLAQHVHLIGHLEEPARLVADADCFVMSSREEGLGTSVLDAMALGTPVASTTAGGLPEMLQDGAGVLAPPNDPLALADAVARLLTEPGLGREVAGRATAAVERFTARRMAEAVRSVYRSCVSFP